MRKSTHLLLILATGITLCNCSVTLGNKSHSALMKLQKGMTKEETDKLLGKPDFRRFDGNLEQWEYQNGGLGVYTKYLIVEFENDAVKSMDSFNEISKKSIMEKMSIEKTSLHVTGSVKDNEFDKIYNNVKNAVFKEDTLERVIRNREFSCAQCLRFLSLYTFDNDKLKMLEILKKHIVDTENYDDIINSLDFISNRDKAKEILGIPRR